MGRLVLSLNTEILDKILCNKKILHYIPTQDFLPSIDISKLDNIHIEKSIKKKNLVFSLAKVQNENDVYPIYFILYVDNKNRLRAYIPKHGNLYNPWCLCAFGDESIFINSIKSITRMPKKYYELDEDKGFYKESQQYINDFEKTKLKEDKNQMINEFITLFKAVKKEL